MTLAPLAFRVLGGAENRREVVSYHKAALAYAHADPAIRTDIQTFLSAYAFPRDLRDHMARTSGSTAGYAGPVGVPYLHFDIDRPDLAVAIRDAARLSHYLADRYAADLVVSYSGSKGFHIDLPMGECVDPSPRVHRVAKALALRLAHDAGVVIDTGVYDAVRLWRASNTAHAKTGRYKVRIDVDDLPHMNAERVHRLAAEPIPFDPPVSASPPPRRLVDDWRDAEVEARRQARPRPERRAGDPSRAKVNPTTRLLLTDATAIRTGERHAVIFSAAANLAEYGDADDLIVALLTEPALDTGLPPREVDRQIRCGIEHARRQRGEGEGVAP